VYLIAKAIEIYSFPQAPNKTLKVQKLEKKNYEQIIILKDHFFTVVIGIRFLSNS